MEDMKPTAVEPQAADNIEEALSLYYQLAEEMKYPVFAMQTLAQSCGRQTVDELRRFVALCRRARSTASGTEGVEVRMALKQADRAGRRGDTRTAPVRPRCARRTHARTSPEKG